MFTKYASFFCSVCLFLLTIRNEAFAQSSPTNSSFVREEPVVTKIMIAFEAYSRIQPIKRAFVIQIFNGTKAEADKIKVKFLEQFPDQNLRTIYQFPEYRLQTGDYKTKIEADHYLSKIREQFPGAFIVHFNR